MRKIFVVFISLHLILSPVVLAQGTGDQFRNSKPKNGGMSFYMNQVLSLGTGLIGAEILMHCPLGGTYPSFPIFLAGSLVYIGSEILGGKSQQAYHKKTTSSLEISEEKLKGGDYQRETLETALKEEKQILAFINKRKMWLMAVTAVYTAATAAAIIEAMNPLEKAAPPACPTGAGIVGSKISSGLLQKAIILAYTFSAGKSGGAISQYGGMALQLGIMTTGLSAMVWKLYGKAIPRSITFGASAALAAGVTMGLNGKAKVINGNIEKLEKALADFDSASKNTRGLTPTGGATSGADGGSGAGGGNVNTTAGTYNALPTVENGPRTCFGQTNQGVQFTESSCKSSIRVASPRFDSNLNVPTLEAATVAATDMANSLSSGDLGKAEVQASALANMAGKLDQVKDNLEKQLNDKLIAQGKKPIDFDKEVGAQVASFANTANGGKGAGDTGLASLDTSSSSLSETEKEVEKYQEIKGAAGTAVLGAPSISEGSISTTITEGDTVTEAPKGDIATLSEYEVNEADVSKQSDVSLFQQLSNRYLLAYPKIFEQKKLEEEAPAKPIEN